MIHRKLFSTVGGVLLLLFFGLFSSGCISSSGPLQIEPLKLKSATIVPKFTDSYYYYDSDQTVNFILRSKTTDQSTGKPVEQIASFRVFWRPIGGKTSLNPTSIDATYRYAIITPDSVGLYEGAGFVRLWGKNGVRRLQARIYAGDLRLTQASNNFVDNVGRGRIEGNFTATYDDVRATDMLLEARQEFFARSLVTIQPSTSAPATSPVNPPLPLPPAAPAR